MGPGDRAQGGRNKDIASSLTVCHTAQCALQPMVIFFAACLHCIHSAATDRFWKYAKMGVRPPGPDGLAGPLLKHKEV